ncbi:MAG: PilN domain-containing protein [Patescibacteria group bacterium]
MPAKKRKSDLINLLPQEEFASSIMGRILAWLLTTFRTIVIISEMIVMAAFLSRFWLDAKNNDLSDSITQRKAVVGSYETLEKNFRAAQKKLSIFALVADPIPNQHTIIETAGSILPSDMTMTSITFTNKEVSLKGTSGSEKSIANYTASLKNTSLFSDLSINQITYDTEKSSLIFDIKATATGGQNGI